MKIVVFDTETTNLEKPFCYNIGYAIFDTDTQECLIAKDFVVEQVWHNKPLFESAYYAEKRPIYVSRMKARKVVMDKFGYITQEMIRDFKALAVEQAYAYNSPFDDKVFEFNCEWFKCNNPFDNIPIFDIRGYVHNKIAFTDEYKQFAEENQLFTESGNYSTTAEALFKFIDKNIDFSEEHTALADSIIEAKILFDCVRRGCEYGKEYKVYRTIPREVERELKIYMGEDKQEFTFKYKKRTNREGGNKIYLK